MNILYVLFLAVLAIEVRGASVNHYKKDDSESSEEMYLDVGEPDDWKVAHVRRILAQNDFAKTEANGYFSKNSRVLPAKVFRSLMAANGYKIGDKEPTKAPVITKCVGSNCRKAFGMGHDDDDEIDDTYDDDDGIFDNSGPHFSMEAPDSMVFRRTLENGYMQNDDVSEISAVL